MDNQNNTTAITPYVDAQEKFSIACKQAEGLVLMENAGAAFQAVVTVKTLREILTDEIMKNVFMPLMNTKIGFLTDRNGRPNKNGQTLPLYTVEVVRDAIIDAASIGILPVFNQMNIIAEKMYPTKEGYTALLKKINVKYFLTFGQDMSAADAKFADITVKVNYEYKDEKSSFAFQSLMPKNAYSSYDQLKGKAERRGKKLLYEYLTGRDFGDGDDMQEPEVISTTRFNTTNAETVIPQNEPTETATTTEQNGQRKFEMK